MLLVEDDVEVRETLGEALELAGYEVTPAASAESAIWLLSLKRFDGLLTDFQLQDRDGAWLVEEARRKGLLHNIPTVMLTAHPVPRVPEDVELFRKPVGMAQLIERLAVLIGAE